MKSGLEKYRGGFNPEPNKKLRFTPPFASRGAGVVIAAVGAAAAKHGTVGGVVFGRFRRFRRI